MPKKEALSTIAQNQAKKDLGGLEISTGLILRFLRELSLKRKRDQRSIGRQARNNKGIGGTKIA